MKPSKLLLLVLFFFVLCASVPAVQQEFKFGKIDFNYRNVSAQRSTIVGLDRSKLSRLGKVRDWGMIESYYESMPKWADDVELRYYVLMKGEKPNKPIMLQGSVTYINVQKKRDHVSTMYIPPQAILRYGEVLRVRAELWYNGVLQDAIQWPRVTGKTPWWTRIKPLYGSLFNRFYTPFEHEAETLEEVIKTE